MPAKKLLRVLAGESVSPPPIWLMRQAGRYLPEYRATRAEAGSFLELCHHPALATEVTLQPIRRFGFDAAILFADILLLPQAMGRRLWFETGEGPRLDPLEKETGQAILTLARPDAAVTRLAPVLETVRRLRRALPEETTLIGFAGAPWTVATYMIAGRGKDQQRAAKTMMAERPEDFAALMRRLTDATVAYLAAQANAGAEVVKLFDSWSGALSNDPATFRRWCLEPAAEIAERVRAAAPEVRIALFPRGAGALYEDVAREAGADLLALDQSVDPRWAASALQPRVAVQGGPDPALLVEGGAPLAESARRWLAALGAGPYVFNLGHGVTPEAKPEHVGELVRTVRGA